MALTVEELDRTLDDLAGIQRFVGEAKRLIQRAKRGVPLDNIEELILWNGSTVAVLRAAVAASDRMGQNIAD